MTQNITTDAYRTPNFNGTNLTIKESLIPI